MYRHQIKKETLWISKTTIKGIKRRVGKRYRQEGWAKWEAKKKQWYFKCNETKYFSSLVI